MYESVVRNWRPTHHRKVKKRISLAKISISDGRGVGENIVPIMTVQENAVYGKVPCFIHVFVERVRSERMSACRLTPKKKFDNFKTNYI